ncbi:myosin heavy chain, embryonic smooth muscle isoform-like [Quercus lobata]|uniref:myosin heavy chain, embryonic smooth muscle isoform-like n=1 Tax=Quercus lobata TaxID=97700 RepID=UPI001245AA55|nr:myosin heavy chain, embryonic smooth muscle isoform-like [Quercus lobata]
MVDTGKSHPTREEKAQRATKQQKVSHTLQWGQERSDTQPPEPQAWLPSPMHSGEPLRDEASLRDFNGGIGCHVALAVEEALLLARDMAELKNARKNKLILNNKRYLGIVIQNTFRPDEMFNNCYQQLENERKKRMSAVQTLTISEHNLAEARKKLTAKEQDRRSADSALEGTQRQAEDQRKRPREANEELKAAREQLAALKKQLEETQRLKDQVEKSKKEAEKAKVEAEKAMDVAEQKGYDLEVAETEETLRAEVPVVCHIYCAQTWDEALNRAGVEASSELRKAENVFYPPAI